MEEGVKSLTNSSATSSSTVNSTTNSSRRNSVESVASVTSTASSGQPKARKSFNPNSRTSSPMLNGEVEKKNLPQVIFFQSYKIFKENLFPNEDYER